MSTEQLEELGPIDYVVFEWQGEQPDAGEIQPLLLDLVDRGVVRILDIAFVAKDPDASVSAIELGDLKQMSAARRQQPRLAPPGRALAAAGDYPYGQPQPAQQEPALEYAAPPQAAPAPDPIQQLKDLAELRDQGVLTEEEFAAQKSRILNT